MANGKFICSSVKYFALSTLRKADYFLLEGFVASEELALHLFFKMLTGLGMISPGAAAVLCRNTGFIHVAGQLVSEYLECRNKLCFIFATPARCRSSKIHYTNPKRSSVYPEGLSRRKNNSKEQRRGHQTWKLEAIF